MFRPTFSMALNSPLPQAIGTVPENISGVAAAVNEATEILLMDPLAPDEGWWGGWVEMLFTLTVSNFTAFITTPNEIARIIVLDICTRPRKIRNGFYEYLQFSAGHQPKPCQTTCAQVQQVFERDSVPTLVPFPTTAPQGIRVYITNNADRGRRIVLQGPDQNGNTVYGVDPTTAQAILGETVTFALPFANALNKFQNLTGILKDQTLGPVQVFTVDPVTGAQTLLTTMAPNETTANYRRYFFNGVPPQCCNTPNGLVQVHAQCKLDYVPVVSPSDYLRILSIPALIDECMSRKYSRQDNSTSANLEAKHHTKAISILNGQLDHFLGKTSTVVNVPIFGSDRLRPQPK